MPPLLAHITHAATYSAEDVQHLCQVGGLRPDDPNMFLDQLDTISRVYRWEADKWQDRPQNSAIARDLNRVKRKLNALMECIETLPEGSADALARSVDIDSTNDGMTALRKPSHLRNPSLAVVENSDPEQPTILCIDLEGFERLMGGMDISIQNAIKRLPKQQRGAPPDFALSLWMSNIKSLWERTTDAPFRRDVTDAGDPVTPAARFCVEAFRVIAPDHPQSRVLNAMRAQIQSERR